MATQSSYSRKGANKTVLGCLSRFEVWLSPVAKTSVFGDGINPNSNYNPAKLVLLTQN
jgi:hypothetical protein